MQEQKVTKGKLAGLMPKYPVFAYVYSIRTLLIVFVVLIVLPVWAFSAYVATKYAVSQRNALESSAKGIAASVATAVDFRLRGIEATMAMLAISATLRTNDLASFYEQAHTFSTTHHMTIALVGLDGNVIFNTNAPFGTVLQNARPDTRALEAITSRSVRYSRVFFGNVSREWLTAVSMPVITDGEPRYALVVAVPSVERWGEILQAPELPKGWFISLADDANVILASDPDSRAFVGQTISPDALEVINKVGGGWGAGKSRDGKPVYYAYEHAKVTPWLVQVGVPGEELDGAIYKALMPVVIGGLTLLACTMLVAWMVGRRFSEQLVSISQAATAYRLGQPLASVVKPSHIREFVEMKAMMESAGAERTRNEQSLRSLIGDKDMLMQEIHHRVKNSLQLVRGILSLQARSSGHPEAKAALEAAAARILTVADVHQHLYQDISTVDVNVGQYLTELGRELTLSMLDGAKDRTIHVEAPQVMWHSEKMIAIGLITTELVTNAVKYGAGTVSVRLDVDGDGSAVLTVEDQGQGFSKDYRMGEGGGLGSKLIANLVRKDEGQVRIDRTVPFGRVIVGLSPQWRNRTPVTT